MNIGELRTLVPQIDWRRYLSIVLARPVNFSEPVVVFALQYIQDLVVLLSKTRARYTTCFFSFPFFFLLCDLVWFRMNAFTRFMWQFLQNSGKLPTMEICAAPSEQSRRSFPGSETKILLYTVRQGASAVKMEKLCHPGEFQHGHGGRFDVCKEIFRRKQ